MVVRKVLDGVLIIVLGTLLEVDVDLVLELLTSFFSFCFSCDGF